MDAVRLYVGGGEDDFIEWRRQQDHAKIGCSIEGSGGILSLRRHFVCIGDMNRMYTQRKRGGGFMCIEDEGFWRVMNRALLKTKQPICEEPY